MSDAGHSARKRLLSPLQGGAGPESGRAVRQKACADADGTLELPFVLPEVEQLLNKLVP